MAKNFKTLREKMSPEAQAHAAAKADQMNQHLIHVLARAFLLSVITAGVYLSQILDVGRASPDRPSATCLAPRWGRSWATLRPSLCSTA